MSRYDKQALATLAASHIILGVIPDNFEISPVLKEKIELVRGMLLIAASSWPGKIVEEDTLIFTQQMDKWLGKVSEYDDPPGLMYCLATTAQTALTDLYERPSTRDFRCDKRPLLEPLFPSIQEICDFLEARLTSHIACETAEKLVRELKEVVGWE